MSKHRSGSSGGSNADALYSANHVPDPVTEGAVAAAMAATDRQPRHPTWERFAWALGVFFFVVASFASVLGLINSIQISHQNSELKKQADCLTSVVLQFEDDQLNRASISSDDRDAIRNLVKKVFTSTTVEAKIKAYNDFVTASNHNDARRALIGTQLKPDCKLPGVVQTTVNHIPLTPLPSATIKHALPTTPRSGRSSVQRSSSSSAKQNSLKNSDVAKAASSVAPTSVPVPSSSTTRSAVQTSGPSPVTSVLCSDLPLIELCP